MIQQDSAKFWLPRIQKDPWLRTMIPNTVMVNYSEEALALSLRGKPTAEYDRLYYAVEAAIRHEVGYPAFIRTDITSAKHAGKRAWYVENEDALNDALLVTLSKSELKTYFQKIKGSAIMVRHFLDLAQWEPRTAFGGLPIAKEWRVFMKHGESGVQCIHSYWPTEALEGYMDDGFPPHGDKWPEFWISSECMDAAKRAVELIGEGKWSVDFAQDKNGKYWLLDMATAGNSYHADGCQYKVLDIENSLW